MGNCEKPIKSHMLILAWHYDNRTWPHTVNKLQQVTFAIHLRLSSALIIYIKSQVLHSVPERPISWLLLSLALCVVGKSRLIYKKSSRWGKPLKQTQTLNKGGMEESLLKECGSSFNCWYACGTSCQEKKNPRKKQTQEMQNNANLLLPADWLIGTCRLSLLFKLLKALKDQV